MGGAPPPPVLDAGRSAAGVLCLVMFLASSGHFGANWRQKPSKIIFQNSPVVFQNALLGSMFAPLDSILTSFWLHCGCQKPSFSLPQRGDGKRCEKGGGGRFLAPKSTLGRIIFWLSFGTSFLSSKWGAFSVKCGL